MSGNRIKRVAIAGGTHGNELRGIYLVKKFQKLPHLIQRSSFESVTFFANPKAYEIGKRYFDTDLNRSFTELDLENPNLSTYEAQRAKEIYRTFGTGGSVIKKWSQPKLTITFLFPVPSVSALSRIKSRRLNRTGVGW